MSKIHLSGFDVKSYLRDREIEFQSSGKNISSGWVGITCVFCSDENNHLGIHLKQKRYSCWICGKTGSVDYLIKTIEKCGWNKVEQIVDQFRGDVEDDFDEDYESSNASSVLLPEEAVTVFPKLHNDFLKQRHFNSRRIIRKYKLLACANQGKYKFRIIVPYFLNNKIITFSARDVTGRASSSYLNLSNEKSVISIKHTFYNIDNAGKNIVIVEGVTDVWRIGDGAIGATGVVISKEQIILLLERGVENILVLFDSEPEAVERANRLAGNLAMHTDTINVLQGVLRRNDPDKMNDSSLSKVRKFIREGL